MWPTAAQTRHINCGLPPEFFFVAPASSFQHHEANFEPHTLNPSIGVIPLLTATPCLAPTSIGGGGDEDVMNAAARSRGGMQLWQQHGQNHNSSYLKKPVMLDHTTNLGGSSNSTSLGTATCQDCGNQAKKDCPHRRCRTCCKSRGYDCPTHVKSTWVPVARRRERQLMGASTTPAGGASSQSTLSAKKPRLAGGASQTTSHTSTSNTTPRSFDASSSHQDASFKESLPGQVRAPAVFKCVRVTAVDDGDDEYAYQAVVNIGGHVFKGFLYDQGVEGKYIFPNMSELHLGGGGGGRNETSSSPPGLDPSDIYGASGGGLLGGSNYGNQIN